MARLVSRLTSFSEKEIQSLFKSIKMRFKESGLEIRFGQAKATPGRLLLIIPKRVGSAPLRNRLRRRLKAIFYTNKWYEKNIDIIITVLPEATRLSYAELEEIFQHAFSYYDKKFSHTAHSNTTPDDGNL